LFINKIYQSASKDYKVRETVTMLEMIIELNQEILEIS